MLKGTLDDFTLPDIIRLLSNAKKTGSLEVERSAGQGTVYFSEGDVYFAESSISKELLGQKLVKSGVITSNQLMKALDEQANSGGRLGEVLLSSGLVFEDQLESAVRAQIEDAVFDLLRWELGEFSWTAGETVEPEVALSVSVENLIMEASRRLDELDVIKRKIPSEHTVLNMAPAPPEGAVEINITPDEWRVMVLVNGNRSVLEIAETVGLDVFQAMRTLYGLVSAGLIEAPGGVEQDVDAEAEAYAVEVDEAPADTFDEASADEVVVDEAPTEEPVSEEIVEENFEPVADAQVDDAVAEHELEPVAEADTEVAEPSFESQHGEVEPDEGADTDAQDLVAEVLGDDVETSVEAFDAPEPGDLTTEVPSDAASFSDADPFAEEILAPQGTSDQFDPSPSVEADTEPSEVSELDQQLASVTDIPVTSEPEGPSVDKSAAVRELSNLFKQTEVDSNPTFLVPPLEKKEEPAAPPEDKKRVEDDEEITRGLISRLIDGVKGL